MQTPFANVSSPIRIKIGSSENLFVGDFKDVNESDFNILYALSLV